jgi:predicted small secreted protein
MKDEGGRMRDRRTLIIILGIALLIVSACNTVRRSGIPAGAQTALDAAIEDIDAGRYDELYEAAADEWKRQSADQSKANLQTLRDKLGRARTRDLQTAREEQTSTGPVPGHSVTVIYQTSFDRGEGMETFMLIEHSGSWALAKYYVSSSGLK